MTLIAQICILNVIMKNLIQDMQLIRQFNTPLSGVFLTSDLIQLLAEPHKTAVYRRIAALEQAALIERFIKGVYITSEVDLKILNHKICSDSYVSFGSILVEHEIIQTHPAHSIDAIKPGKSRIHRNKRYRVRQLGVSPHLIFGFEQRQGIKQALPEKALLDTFYFHLHGVAFPFDIYRDIQWKKVDKDILSIYLQEYQNPKFVAFIQKFIGARNPGTL